MLDEGGKAWLIEVNTNPSLDHSCPLLSGLIPRMLDGALGLTVDALFPGPVAACSEGWEFLCSLQPPLKSTKKK
jgi:hypothetical protein